MHELFCQSCGMPMGSADLQGTNCDGTKNEEYCTYCYQNGVFTSPEITMEQMIEVCVPYMKEEGIQEDDARKQLNALFPTLKRWQSEKV